LVGYLIEEGENDLLLSVASPWEIAIKHALGRLSLAEPFDVLIPREIQANDIRLLPIDLAHTAQVAVLPMHHRDPFDRMLIAQAFVEQVTVLSADPAFDPYSVTRVW
jgi:PIN domain nuclease of toxin-antitoxin system